MKKILALVLTLTMVLGTFTFAAAAPEDVVGTDCEDAVARLMALDIISGFPDGTYKPDEPVTRAQFAKIIVSALGVGEAANYAAGATKFADVPADHWATGYINVAVDMGVIAGYPDGTFKPENQVTFAEAIKMIVAGLGYTPKANALGGYPGGYLAVAAEEGITEDVTVVSTLSANRGAVAMMVDNALDVDLMEQTSYGDSPEWKAIAGKTLLNSKLDVEELKGTVVAISKTAKLDENEFEMEDEDGDPIKETFEMAIDVNTESLFLKDVKILHKDEEVVWVSVETAEKDILFDTVVIGGANDAEQVELKVADKKYNWVDDDIDKATIYVNYEEYNDGNAKNLEGMYGYFIFDGKEIKAANLFSFDYKGFVTKVAEDEIEYVDLYTADEEVLELDEYDEVFVYNKDFTKAELDDVDENTVMFYWEGEDDELFVMVADEVVEGEVTRVRDDRVTIDGKNYVRAKNDDEITAIASLDKGEDFEKWVDINTGDVIDEEVTLYLDLNGQIAAMVTSAKATSDTMYGIVTWYYDGRDPSIAVYTTDDEEVEYFFEERADADIFEDHFKNNETIWAIEYELNSDGEIAEESFKIRADSVKGEGGDFDVKYEKIAELQNIVLKKTKDKKFVTDTVEDEDYYINSGTVLMKALNDKNEIDPDLVDYEALVDTSFDNTIGKALIFGDAKKDADMIVFLHKDFVGTKDDVYFGVVTDDTWRVGDDWFAKVDVFGEGEDEYEVDKNEVREGDLVAFTLKSSGKANVLVSGVADDTDTKAQIVTGTVYDVDDDYITLNAVDGPEYRIANSAVLYKTEGPDLDDDLDGTIRLTRIDKGDKIALLYDPDEKEVVAAIVAPKED
jgi:hypothetical protein